MDNAPQTIAGVVDLIDALPRPVTVACFVESLARPMTVIGSSSFFSAQPAAGAEAPRIFAVYDAMIMSFVPDGDGSYLLEFAEERPSNLSVKAEVHMPVEGEITYDDAFDHLRFREGTVCGSCHRAEEPAQDIEYGDAYVSLALRPATHETVRVDEIRAQALACDSEATPRRCEIYDALFGGGDVHDGDFPRSLPTIYD